MQSGQHLIDLLLQHPRQKPQPPQTPPAYSDSQTRDVVPPAAPPSEPIPAHHRPKALHLPPRQIEKNRLQAHFLPHRQLFRRSLQHRSSLNSASPNRIAHIRRNFLMQQAKRGLRSAVHGKHGHPRTLLPNHHPHPLIQKSGRQKRHIHRHKQIPLLRTSAKVPPQSLPAARTPHADPEPAARKPPTPAGSPVHKHPHKPAAASPPPRSTSGLPANFSRALSCPMRELFPPASTYPLTSDGACPSIKHPAAQKTAQSTRSRDENSPDETSHSEHEDCHPATQTPSSP